MTPRTASRPGSRRPGTRRRRIGVAAVLAVVLAAGAYVPLALLSPVAPAAASAEQYTAPTPAAPELTFPDYGATAVQALGFDDSLTTSGDDQPRAIASISKVISALVVLDSHPLDDGDGPTITFDADDAALYDAYLARDGKVAPMPAGLRLTERQALEVSLIESANNYADALATWAFGSTDAYVAAADEWLDENGMTSTTVVEPTGMSPENTSTATDLLSLGRLALADPVVAEIVRTETTTIPGVGEIENSNELLGLDGVSGIKTGTLDEAGACLLFSADYTIAGQDVTVVGVMLGERTTTRWTSMCRPSWRASPRGSRRSTSPAPATPSDGTRCRGAPPPRRSPPTTRASSSGEPRPSTRPSPSTTWDPTTPDARWARSPSRSTTRPSTCRSSWTGRSRSPEPGGG
nr:hypothetical protein GCM10025699_53840 [Microbacterium flavescens]